MKYTVINAEGVIADGIAKKAKAVEVAEANRGATPVEVVTDKGTVVHTVAPIKKINMSKPYTRVVPVPEEVAEVIDGKRVAYKRGRPGAQFALLDAAKGDYSIWDVDRGERVDVEVSTTREAGRWFADERQAYRAANPVVVAD